MMLDVGGAGIDLFESTGEIGLFGFGGLGIRILVFF